MNQIVRLFISPIVVLQMACSLDVRKATVPSDPPRGVKSNFSLQQITGSYIQSGSPKMFLWPDEKWDMKSQKYVPMSFQEKVESRQKITAYADDVTLYEGQAEDAELALNQKYENLKQDLTNEYLGNQCYGLCMPDGGIFCLPDTPNLDPIGEGEWKEPESPEEEQLILSCQANQSRRQTLDSEKNEEKILNVDPLYQKAGDAGLALLEEVGDRNYFTDLTKLEFTYGEVSCFATSELCQHAHGEPQIFLNLKYGDLSISNFLENPSKLKVSAVELDQVDGYLTFKMPAVNLENDDKIYGEITFELEFVKSGDRLSVNGDFRIVSFDSNEEKIGRFASSGKITD